MWVLNYSTRLAAGLGDLGSAHQGPRAARDDVLRLCLDQHIVHHIRGGLPRVYVSFHVGPAETR